jgi:hypothetical protein
MPACRRSIILSLLAFLGLVTGFLAPLPTNNRRPAVTFVLAAAETTTTVEVCGNKDCKRAGGGPRLEKLINEVSSSICCRESRERVPLWACAASVHHIRLTNDLFFFFLKKSCRSYKRRVYRVNFQSWNASARASVDTDPI